MDLSVTKSDFFELDADNPENGYVLVEGTDVIGSLNQQLAERLKEIDAFEAVIKWENFVHLSGREVISDVFSLAAGTDDKNIGLKNIYYKLAEAMYGKKISSDVSQIAARACIIFNDLLHDRLEYNINTLFKCEILKEILRPETFDASQKGIFNSMLLLSFDKSTEVSPGNVYAKTSAEVEAYPYNALLADAIDITRVAAEFYMSKNEGSKPEPGQVREYKNENKKEYQKFEKDLRDRIKSGSTFVDIESSPICDYAQNKWKANRLSPAILIPESHLWAVARAEYLYLSPSFSIGGNLSRILIDMRYFTSIPLATLTSAKQGPIFRLKHQFLIDIQSSLSKHVSRPGISSIN